MGSPALLADCHLHFEGSLPLKAVEALARRSGHPFAVPGSLAVRREAVRDSRGFLALFAEICALFGSPDDYAFAADALARSLADDGVGYAEIYFSPEICARFNLDPAECLAAVDAGFAAGADGVKADCRILLDTVRHWGAEAAERVLDVHERRPLARVVGFGMGGDEASHPAAEFRRAYERARSLNLSTSVHAGEWRGPDSVREALEVLRPDRIDHGIAAALDPELLARLADLGIPLMVAPTGNVRTSAVSSFDSHPLARLLTSGVAVALSADDPLLFDTTTSGEYRVAAIRCSIPEEQLRQMARCSWTSAFGLSPTEKERGVGGIARIRFQAPGEVE